MLSNISKIYKGEPITKKVKSVLLIFRTNTDIEIWDQNKRRLFEKPKEKKRISINQL